jgi:hypothetical protein
MRGDLSETAAADACRELAGLGATGAFEVDGPDGPARVLFRDGRLVAAVSPTPRARLGDRLVSAGVLDDAVLTDALGRQARADVRPRLGALLVADGLVDDDAVQRHAREQLLDALVEIVGWHYGAFRFVEGAGDEFAEVPLDLDVDEALDEAARRQREWDELARLVPHLDAIPEVREHPAEVDASLTPDERAVFDAVDGVRSLRQLARELGLGELEATRAVHELSLLGVIDVRLPEDEIGAALDEAFASLGARYEAATDDDVPTARDTGLAEPPEERRPRPGAEAAPAEPAAAPAEPAAAPAEREAAPAEPGSEHPAPSTAWSHLREQADLADEPEPEPYVLPIADAPANATALGEDDLETELPPLAEVEAELPGEPDPDLPGESDPEPPGEGDATLPDEAAPSAPAAPAGPAAGTDVSEFLRELSRLAFDDPSPDEPATRSRPRPDEPAARPAADDRKRKRRGLFGLGG